MKRILTFLITIILCISISTPLFACQGGKEESSIITITYFDGDDRIDVETLNKDENPNLLKRNKEGLFFTGWYLDKECTKRFDISEAKGEVSLYAGWSKLYNTISGIITIEKLDIPNLSKVSSLIPFKSLKYTIYYQPTENGIDFVVKIGVQGISLYEVYYIDGILITGKQGALGIELSDPKNIGTTNSLIDELKADETFGQIATKILEKFNFGFDESSVNYTLFDKDFNKFYEIDATEKANKLVNFVKQNAKKPIFNIIIDAINKDEKIITEEDVDEFILDLIKELIDLDNITFDNIAEELINFYNSKVKDQTKQIKDITDAIKKIYALFEDDIGVSEDEFVDIVNDVRTKKLPSLEQIADAFVDFVQDKLDINAEEIIQSVKEYVDLMIEEIKNGENLEKHILKIYDIIKNIEKTVEEDFKNLEEGISVYITKGYIPLFEKITLNDLLLIDECNDEQLAQLIVYILADENRTATASIINDICSFSADKLYGGANVSTDENGRLTDISVMLDIDFKYDNEDYAVALKINFDFTYDTFIDDVFGN